MALKCVLFAELRGRPFNEGGYICVFYTKQSNAKIIIEKMVW